MNAEQQFDQMVCLIGTNPLPVYLGIRQFVRPNGKVILIHSGEVKKDFGLSTGTAGVAQRIKRALGMDNVILEPLNDPYSPAAVAEKFESLKKAGRIGVQSALNYTGGTKVMSAFAVLAWQQMFSNIDRTLYLQDEESLFRFGDGTHSPLDVRLTMDALSNLHNTSPIYNEAFPSCTFDDLWAMLEAWRNKQLQYYWYPFEGKKKWCDISGSDDESPQLRLLRTQYDSQNREWTGREWNTCLDFLTQETRDKWKQTKLPTSVRLYKGDAKSDTPTSELYKQFRFFVNNAWMEMLVLSIVRSLPDAPSLFSAVSAGSIPVNPLVPLDYVRAGQNYIVHNQKFESDIVLYLNHRLKYISVTISTKTDIVKEKAFEAIYRAQQIGGGLASYCVVSLADDKVTQDLNKSLDNAHSRNRVFGLSDLQSWLNGQADSLYHFLTH